MDPPPAYDTVVQPCRNPYIASRQQQQPQHDVTAPLLRSTFDPVTITVRENGSAGQTATAPMPEGWMERDVSAVDWDVFVGQVAGVKDSSSEGSGAVGVLVGEWNAWFFAPRGCLVVLGGGGREADDGDGDDEAEVTCGGGKGFYTVTDGRVGFTIGGAFVGFVGEKDEVGLKIGPVVLGVTQVRREEEERGVELQVV